MLRRVHRMFSVVVVACFFATCPVAQSASFVVGSQVLGDFDLPNSQPTSFNVDFSSLSSVRGIGLIADWTAVVADNGGGTFPWALDLRLEAQSPTGDSLVWDPIGGDVTIADYPLADFSPHYATSQPAGQYTITASAPGVPTPFVSGLRSATVYAMEETPDVVFEYDGDVDAGPTWNRPFDIGNISGLGPVIYDAVEFTVPVSGGYEFLSVLAMDRNNFTFLYRGEFNPDQPLDNLLDYGVGTGAAQNGTPRGTSLIEALLLEGETYHYVTSQFEAALPGGDFETTITGPAEILIPLTPADGDFDDDGIYGCSDLDLLYGAILGNTGAATFDITGDGIVDTTDLDAWLCEAGAVNLGPGRCYLPGDANLDGVVDVGDFNAWNQSKFTGDRGWCGGDYNADGIVDVGDFNIWNQNKFQVADVAVVPEPSGIGWLAAISLILTCRIRQRN